MVNSSPLCTLIAQHPHPGFLYLKSLFQDHHSVYTDLANQSSSVATQLNLLLQQTQKTVPHSSEFTFKPNDQINDDLIYEERIARTGIIATFENWHDLFNGLVWLRFPMSKNSIIQRHIQHFHNSYRGVRGKVRDAATLFDENGLIVLATNSSLLESICRFEWRQLFVEHRALLTHQLKFIIFGHSIYEKLLNPYLGITAHCLLFQVDNATFTKPPNQLLNWLDKRLSIFLADQTKVTTPQELAPLPVMGIPDWHQENQHQEFYNNPHVFRNRRKSCVSCNGLIPNSFQF